MGRFLGGFDEEEYSDSESESSDDDVIDVVQLEFLRGFQNSDDDSTEEEEEEKDFVAYQDFIQAFEAEESDSGPLWTTEEEDNAEVELGISFPVPCEEPSFPHFLNPWLQPEELLKSCSQEFEEPSGLDPPAMVLTYSS